MIYQTPGPKNSKNTIQLSIKRARELNIKHIVAPSSYGKTAESLIPYSSEFNIVIIKQVYGYTESGNPMPVEVEKKIISAGIKVLSATHVLSGAERGLSSRFGGVYPVEIMAHTLKMFGSGIKVCVEVGIMAYDAGCTPRDKQIIAMGGSGRGVDASIVFSPAHAQNILNSRIHEIICKPW